MKKILVIDDEKDFCFFLKKNLEAVGDFEVFISNDGKEGIESAKEITPDLILLDIVMPGMDGPKVADELKKNQITKNIPVVFLTAIVGEKETEKQSHFIGGWHYLAKPVRIGEILNLINELTSKPRYTQP